jgi:hypothetical protein
MVRICSARTVAARWGVAGSVVLGGACVVGADCVREGGTGAGGSVRSISDAVVDCACFTLLRVLLPLSRCFDCLGWFVRCVSFPRGHSWGVSGAFWLRLHGGRRIRERLKRNQSVSVAASKPVSLAADRSMAARMSTVR